MEGAIRFAQVWAFNSRDCVQIINSKVSLAGLDPHGRVSSARLALRGKLRPCTYTYSPSGDHPRTSEHMPKPDILMGGGNVFLHSTALWKNKSGKEIYLEIGYGYLDEDKAPVGKVWCLTVKGRYFLLLQPTGVESEFRRIGVGQIPIWNGEDQFDVITQMYLV
jgi:hypothetical protein